MRDLSCRRLSWHEREAYLLENDLVRLVTLTGGGHVAEFCFKESTGFSTLSPFWIPHWKTIEPYRYLEKRHLSKYGTLTEGKLLSGIAGHSICLDYFGPPSEEEAAQGRSFHGEAPVLKWKKTKTTVGKEQAALKLSVRLPLAGLRFSRQISLRRGESVAYFEETVENERKADHLFHWTQHVTLAPPFLSPLESVVSLPGTKGMTYPHGYDEGKALLASARSFRWPKAPALAGGSIDLTRPFAHTGLGFVAGVLLDPKKDMGFVAALNVRHCLLIAYPQFRSWRLGNMLGSTE